MPLKRLSDAHESTDYHEYRDRKGMVMIYEYNITEVICRASRRA